MDEAEVLKVENSSVEVLVIKKNNEISGTEAIREAINLLRMEE